jgi:hypothetical protein
MFKLTNIIISLTLSTILSADSPISIDQTAAMFTNALPLIFIKNQVMACESITTPKNYASCGPAITDPSASCCFLTRNVNNTQVSQCAAVPTDAKTLYNDTYVKQNYTIDCPLINNNTDSLSFSTPLNDDDAHTVVIANNLLNGIPDKVQTCRSTPSPTALENCSPVVLNDSAQCCYVYGTNSNNQTVSTCEAIPNASENLMGGLYGLLSISMECSGGLYQLSLLIYVLIFIII